MGKASRDKGARNERSVVQEHRAAGIEAERVPLSGAAGGSYKGDIIVERAMRFEAKKRGDGFKRLYEWLEGNDGLFIGADRKPTLAVIPLSTFLSLLQLLKRQGICISELMARSKEQASDVSTSPELRKP